MCFFRVVNIEKYQIPLHEIRRATENFSSESRIGDGGFGIVHKGQLSEDWQNRTVAIKCLKREGYQGNNEFCNELAMVSNFHHPNIITFIGYCDESNKMIIVYDYAVNGSLDYHLENPDKRCLLTWTQRLKICLGAAKGLKYLHSGLGEDKRVIHRDVKSANILLDDKFEAKISDFGLSKVGARNQGHTEGDITRAAGTRYYMDPLYIERSRLKKESDVYSFGVVMFELSSGTLVYIPKCFGKTTEPQYLIDAVRSYYDDDDNSEGPDKLIDPILRGLIDMRSFNAFNKLAHECLNLRLRERPTMDLIIHKLEEALNIQLIHDELTMIKRSLEGFLIPVMKTKLATANFSQENCIRDALFGAIYKGQHPELWQNRTMALARLYPTKYKDKSKFYKELQLISSFHHQNISRFVGYSDEANERIIVHEYVVNGSLHDQLEDSETRNRLTWTQRLKIWIGVARGLQCLQLKIGEDNKAIRGNVNSSNVLLDENMEPKICFFGLSKRGRSKREPRVSDMYSLCIILFEMMFRWKLDYNSVERTAIKYFREQYRRGDIEEYIDPIVSDQIDRRCLDMFEKIAFQMADTWENPETRISMDALVQMIEDASH
ncbi:hypothetical protein LXL04_000901 [Taraxacum kok-saghyz]